jgi:hypothetical protein
MMPFFCPLLDNMVNFYEQLKNRDVFSNHPLQPLAAGSIGYLEDRALQSVYLKVPLALDVVAARAYSLLMSGKNVYATLS